MEKDKFEVSSQKFAEELEIKSVYESSKPLCFIATATNRPGLLFAGFEEHFPMHRVQLLGNAEMFYLNSIGEENAKQKIDKLFAFLPPCVIVARGHRPPEYLLRTAEKYDVSLFCSDLSTEQVESDVINYLSFYRAEHDVIHGELLDIAGLGVLLVGESGIGKSETALELVHRGHMLVSDDVVEVKRIKNRIYGYPPKTTENLLEIRGVGLIDVEAMYGVSGVLSQKRIHLVIEMERWDVNKSYDRLGNDNLTYNILGIDFKKIVVPVSAGRNLAVVIEAASRNFRLNTAGISAVEQLSARLREKNRPSE